MINTVMIDNNSFQNCDKQQYVIIDRPKDIKTNHCIHVSSNRDNGNTLFMQPANGIGIEVPKQLVKPIARDNYYWQQLEELDQ